MKTKKLISSLLILNLLGMNILPCSAGIFTRKDKIIKVKPNSSEYKFKNINLDWWKSYKDTYLEGYIEKAVNENQDLQIATLRVEEAKQNVKLQFSQELPSAQIGISPLLYKTPYTTSTEGSFSIPIVVNYEADIFLKNHDKTKSAKKLYEIAKFNEKAIYISIASQIGATYFNIIKLDKLISLQNQIIKDRKSIFDLMKIRNSQGLTSTADLTRARKAYVTSVADLSDLKKSREILLNSLAVMTGDSPNNINDFKRTSFDKISALKSIPNEISSDIIVQRPDYLSAEKMVEKAGLDVRIAKKEFLPNINILGLLSFNSFSNASSMNWENTLALIGGAAMLDLFKGGAKIANLKLKKNYYEQILQAYYKTNLTAIQEVNDALCSLKLDNDKYIKNLDSYNMQKEDYNYMNIKYNDGLLSKLDLLQQNETLLSMKKMVVASKTDCFINQISLYKAVGGKL